MTSKFNIHPIPSSRIATMDVCAISRHKNHVVGLMEFDVSHVRKTIREQRRNGIETSFNAHVVFAICQALKKHPQMASFLKNKKQQIVFDSISVSMIVEKEVDNQKVPFPLLITEAEQKSVSEIFKLIEESKSVNMEKEDVVLHKKGNKWEKIYYRLPSFLRKFFWKYLLRRPNLAFSKMGNVSITSLGSAGSINGWFIHKSIHPVSFGIGSVIQKPIVKNHEIVAADILNMSILFDHDVVDGAPIVRFVRDLKIEIEKCSL